MCHRAMVELGPTPANSIVLEAMMVVGPTETPVPKAHKMPVMMDAHMVKHTNIIMKNFAFVAAFALPHAFAVPASHLMLMAMWMMKRMVRMQPKSTCQLMKCQLSPKKYHARPMSTWRARYGVSIRPMRQINIRMSLIKLNRLMFMIKLLHFNIFWRFPRHCANKSLSLNNNEADF